MFSCSPSPVASCTFFRGHVMESTCCKLLLVSPCAGLCLFVLLSSVGLAGIPLGDETPLTAGTNQALPRTAQDLSFLFVVIVVKAVTVEAGLRGCHGNLKSHAARCAVSSPAPTRTYGQSHCTARQPHNRGWDGSTFLGCLFMDS